MRGKQRFDQACEAGGPWILPSLLMCDFANLEREARRLEEAGIKILHLDVMDGHFVPNLSYGLPIVASLRKVTNLALDVHLMISDPHKYAPQFADAGADCITFHREAVDDPRPLLRELKDLGVAAGLAFNPKTAIESLQESIDLCDLILVMSVEAGFGGQAFDPVALTKLSTLRAQGPKSLLLEVDGGVNRTTIGACRNAGADLLVVGSAIFKQPDYGEAIGQLTAAMGLPVKDFT